MADDESWEAVDSQSIEEVIDQITELNERLRWFWSQAGGWAPVEAAELLSRSRLDRQVELSRTLHIWTGPAPDAEIEGRLILAWANLGSLVEGTLKLFLSVWLTDYRRDAASRIEVGTLKDPDTLLLEHLRVFMHDRVFDGAWSWNAWVLSVQQRRNAIHSFRERDLGTFGEFELAVRRYFEFLTEMNGQLPYP